MKSIHVYVFFLIVIFHSSCKQNQSTIVKEDATRPKLVKTIGSPRYGNVQSALQDKTGNLWFGTTENGLYNYDGKSFTQFLVSNGLNSNNINSLLEDKDGKIWIGTPKGLCLYDGKTFAEIRIPLPKNLPPNEFRNPHEVFSIMQAKSGKLWFATRDGVYSYDGRSFTPFVINEDSATKNYYYVERILEDKAGNLWFGGRGIKGVYRYDGKSIKNIQLKELVVNESRRVGHSWGWPQLQDKNGNIWFSNWAGAYRYDGKTFSSFTKSDGLPGFGMVARIVEDKKGNLWFGGSGICRYDGKSFTGFKDGLINEGIWAILEDNTGNLWVGTRETGLYLFNGKTFINYSEYKH
ncbi:MAG: two-component regulator propeller domain-containing protein [Bacteroidota bacterium]